MPNQLPAHDAKNKKRLAKLGTVLPKNLAMARKYRSSGNWQKVVKIQKSEFPMCCDPFADHKNEGTTEPMAQVHHVKELAKFFHLRAYKPNLRSICTSCHSKVSVLERQNKPTVYLFRIIPEC